jgi:hypothetical protein
VIFKEWKLNLATLVNHNYSITAVYMSGNDNEMGITMRYIISVNLTINIAIV